MSKAILLSTPQLINLEARLDEILFRAPDDEDQPSVGRSVAKATGVAAGGAAAYGAYRGHLGLMKKYGQARYTGMGGAPTSASRGVGGAYGAAAADVKKKVAGAGAAGLSKFRVMRGARGAGIWQALKGAGRAAAAALDANDPLLYLNELADKAIELADKDDKKSTAKKVAVGAAGTVAGAGAVAGGRALRKDVIKEAGHGSDSGRTSKGFATKKGMYGTYAKKRAKQAKGAADHAGSVIVAHGRQGIKSLRELLGKIRR